MTNPKASRLAVVVLAAGKGKRMKSKLPKVLHPLCGKPALWFVLQTAARLKPDRIVVVVSFGREQIERAVEGFGLKVPVVFVDQGEPRGTGHAVLVAKKAVGTAERVLVMSGDEPLHTPDHLRALLSLQKRRDASAALLTTVLDDATGYGRIIRDGSTFVRIAEQKDASVTERDLREVATMVYAFRRTELFKVLPLVGTANRQKEYYLPDTLALLQERGDKVVAMNADFGGVLGINSRVELAAVSAVMRARINEQHLRNGVTMIDPMLTYIDAGVTIADDATINPVSFLQGDTAIGAGAEIGPGARIRDARIGEGSSVMFSTVTGARIGDGCSVGPYTHIRPGTVLADGARAGSFTEIKGSVIGKDSKVPHLSYVGDAILGAGVNVGAGTITVNYDGYAKHPTKIGDGARIGSDSMLVAPITIGKGAVTGAGSVITKDVPAGALAVERGEQRQVQGYRKRKDAEAAKKRKPTKQSTKQPTKKPTKKPTKGKG